MPWKLYSFFAIDLFKHKKVYKWFLLPNKIPNNEIRCRHYVFKIILTCIKNLTLCLSYRNKLKSHKTRLLDEEEESVDDLVTRRKLNFKLLEQKFQEEI